LLIDERALSRERAQNSYLDDLRSSLRDGLEDAQGVSDSLPPRGKGKASAVQESPLPRKANETTRRHSLYAGITSENGRYPPVARLAPNVDNNPMPPRTAPQNVIAWDAAVDPGLVPLIVESDRPGDARELASLEAKYAERHAFAARLRRQRPEELPREAPERRTEPPPPRMQLKKSVSSFFHRNSEIVIPPSDPVLVTRFTIERALPNEQSSNSRMVVPPPNMNPPYPVSKTKSRAKNDDPELARDLQRILEQEERERQQEDDDLNLALALSLTMENKQPVSPVNDAAFVSLTSAAPLAAPAKRRRSLALRAEESTPTFRSIYDEDEMPFMNWPRRRVSPTENQEAVTYRVEESRSTSNPFRERANEALLRASEASILEQQQLDADRDLALRLMAEETELEAANSSLIESLGQQQVFDCVMCMETNPMDDVAIVDGCNHRFCRDCLRQYLTTKLSEANFPIPCPTCSANKDRASPGGSP